MKRTTGIGIWTACILLLAGMFACSKKDAGETAKETATSTGQNAPGSSASQPLTPENAPFASVITGKGYRVVQAKRFPAQVDARRAYAITYQSNDGNSGGILYVRGFETDAPRPAWHWYFTDGAPDSIAAVDINRDGLWDVRIYMAGGTNREFIQDKDFSFVAPEQDGLFAMNGGASMPDGTWKVFDADTSTAWKAPASNAYLDIPNPLGLKTGQLSVRLAGGSKPQKLEIGDGSRNIQECDLESTREEQRFQLDASVKDLPTIRVTVVGSGKDVAISELGLQ